MATSQQRSIYLPPLGREPGGFLDVLGLPPNASETAVARRAGEVRKKYDDEFRKSRVELNQKKKACEITEDERKEKLATLEEAVSRKLEKLNALKSSYDKQCADRRRMAREGIEDETTPWVELLPAQACSAADLLALAARPRPLQQSSGVMLAALKKKWFEVETEEAVARALPSDEAEFAEQVNLALAVRLHDEQRLVVLLGADMLWAAFRHTNRLWWEAQARAWARDAMGPLRAPRTEYQPSFPTLCLPRNGTVEKLKAEEELVPDLRARRDLMSDLIRLMGLADLNLPAPE